MTSHTSELINHIMSTNACISDTISYIDVVIDNADKYYLSGGLFRCIMRNSFGGYVNAHADIDRIEQGAIKIASTSKIIV